MSEVWEGKTLGFDISFMGILVVGRSLPETGQGWFDKDGAIAKQVYSSSCFVWVCPGV